jgi:hypothetical protein
VDRSAIAASGNGINFARAVTGAPLVRNRH